jgi:hypothetical protein
VRLSLLLHEARHTDGWPHEKCPEPFLDGEGKEVVSPYGGRSLSGAPACDSNAEGSYGLQYVMLKNIEAHCDSCSSNERSQAAQFARFTLQLIQSPAAREKLLTDVGP